MRLKVKSVKYGVVKKPKTEKPSETKPAYLMQSRHNNSTEQFFNLAATPAYSSIQFCCGASCTVSFMCWSSFSRDRTSISAPSRGLIFIRSCSALRRDKSSGQQRTGSCSHGFISRCNSIILGVDGYRPIQMFRNECVLHVVGVVGVNVSFPSFSLPSSGR